MVAKLGLTPFEKDKLTIDPNFDFQEMGARAFADITSNEIGLFKWSGIYHQLQKGFFMMRVRIPGGLLQATQLRQLGEIAEQYAQNELCLTTRQTFQFHWLRKEDLHPVIEALKNINIATTNCCGDVVRNVTTCHLQGVCPYEVTDTRKVIEWIDKDPEFLEEQRNLTRKHKITVSGCGSACGLQLMNCQAWSPITRHNDATGIKETGWVYFAGGGLGQSPFLAKQIFSWVPETLVLEVTRAAVEAHNRFGDRQKRKFGRLKYIVDKFGQKGFALQLLKILQERGITDWEQIEIAEQEKPNIALAPFIGQTVIPQRQTGLNVVRVMIRRAEISGKEARFFAALAEQYGNGEIMLSVRQNLYLYGVPDEKVTALLTALKNNGYRLQGLEQLPDVVACVGTTYCNLAVSDTPNGYKQIMDAFAENAEFWAEVGPLTINMNGCPNSCAHHWVNDIGLRGTKEMRTVGSEEGFTIYVGGSLEGAGHLGEDLQDVAIRELVPTLRQLLQIYLQYRRSGAERFGDFTRRVGITQLRQLLAETPKEESINTESINQRNLKLAATFQAVLQESVNHE